MNIHDQAENIHGQGVNIYGGYGEYLRSAMYSSKLSERQNITAQKKRSLAEVAAAHDARVVHQRSDTMYSRTLFPGIRTNVVRLLHSDNVALLVVILYTKSEELSLVYAIEKVTVRCYVISDVFMYRWTPDESSFFIKLPAI